MAIWRVVDGSPTKLHETKLRSEKLKEDTLEGWIERVPELLGEPLFVIGRQVLIPDTKDRLDLLALDPQGKAVIIELKRGDLKDPVDVQALRYASYVAKWQFAEFEGLAKTYRGTNADFDFNEEFEKFCDDARGEAPDEFNTDQRIIIAGEAVREKLGSVALWLREHNVDIKLVEVRSYRDGDALMIEPKVLVPMEVSRFKEVGKKTADGSPWLTDGKVWHLEKRCSPQMKEMFLAVEGLLDELVEVEGPFWDQKYYISFRRNNFNWLAVHTRPSMLIFDFNVRADTFTKAELAQRLGVVEFDADEDLSEKLGLPSSVTVKKVKEHRDRVRIRAKQGFDVRSKVFRELIQEAYQACPK